MLRPTVAIARVDQVGAWLARHVLVEVDHHLEQLAEFRVEVVQQVVDHSLADQHHLDVERDRLGLERHGADQAQHLSERLGADLARAQRALERLPGERLGKHLDRVEQQVAAVGAVERARLDQGEVGHQRAHLGDVLDAADQVAVRRVVLIHDRRSLGVGVLDQHVDAVAPEGHVGLLALRDWDAELHRLLAFLGLLEHFRVVEHVLLERREVGAHLGHGLVLRLQLLDQAVCRAARHFPV
jgi:hypothetical protein